MTEGDVAVRF